MSLSKSIALLAIAAQPAIAAESDPESVAYFDQTIHPILESQCYVCHGAEKVSGGLVLTNREGLVTGGQRGPGIDLEDPARSIILQMINHADPKQRMPFEKAPLSDKDKAALEKWVLAGAPYNPDREFATKAATGMVIDDQSRSYWAYQTPQKPELRNLSDTFVKNPIDAFVLEELKAAGIQPNPTASSRQLFRRASFDLNGLAPSYEDLEAFASQPPSQESWEQTVDTLLASPRYGEKLASLWLDLVRYAETNGFERDSLKPYIWRYRDYVIDSFNADKPYDRFLTEQLAGDELPDKTFESIIATGYLAAMQRDDEPADPEQAHADMVGDFVDVTGEAFMGTTMGCAKCHDHKGDPIRQADYYSMMAFFDGLRETKFKSPTSYWYNQELIDSRSSKLKNVKDQIAEVWQSVDTNPLYQYQQKPDSPRSILSLGEDDYVQWQAKQVIPNTDDWTLPSFQGEDFKIAERPFQQNPESLGKRNWQRANEYAIRHEFGLTEPPSELYFYLQGATPSKFSIYFNGDLVFEGLPDQIDDTFLVPFSTKEISTLTTGRNAIGVAIEFEKNETFAFDMGLYLDPNQNLPLNALAISKPQLIANNYGRPFAKKLKRLLRQKRNLQNPIPGEAYMGASEAKEIPDAHIHIRGNVHAVGKAVPVAFPAVLVENDQAAIPTYKGNHYSNTKTHGRRLAFANWLTQPDHPLTARVMVNRLWQLYFGVGLVPSSNDFGVLGEGPSNQKLLDWLAVEFVESGWSIKHMTRLMLTSSTYQLSTAPDKAALKADPLNQLHWRHNPRRLTAEEIRDNFLAITGELNLDGGGEPVRPKMPEAILATASKPDRVWPETEGEAANRRSVYVHVKRSIQMPLFSLFDAPERDASCAHRFATTVPTQALTMLNSAFINRQAETLAQMIAGKTATRAQQIDTLFQKTLGRSPNDSERQELNALVESLKTEYNLNEANALNRLALVALNLNETLYLD